MTHIQTRKQKTKTQGAGTFQPVSGEDVGAHAMHWERVSVPLSTMEQVPQKEDDRKKHVKRGRGAPHALAFHPSLTYTPFSNHPNQIEQLIDVSAAGRPIVPVGTTSVRTLESLYWWGLRLLEDGPKQPQHQPQGSRSVGDLMLGQWEPYQRGVTRRDRPFPSAAAALVRLCVAGVACVRGSGVVVWDGRD